MKERQFPRARPGLPLARFGEEVLLRPATAMWALLEFDGGGHL